MASSRMSTTKIAELAGVSRATVSRYFNHRELLGDETAGRVEKAIVELGGDPGAPERKGSRTRPCVLVSCPMGRNPFYGDVLGGIMASAGTHGYDVLVDYSHITDATIVSFERLLRQAKVAGVITLGQLSSRFLEIIAGVAHVVQCCEYNPNADVPWVGIDDHAAARVAMEFLIGAGRTKVALLNGPEEFRYARERRRGYLDAMADAGCAVSPDWIMQVPSIDYDIAFTTVGRLIVSGEMPDALFCASDVLAAAAINAARRNHLHVPQDLMVVGFDNLDVCKMARPTITSVNQPRYQLGYTAADVLASLVQNPETRQGSVVLPTELVVRESAVARQA